tara:strand:+ start:1182 stop:2582 length:1401 start_codon:yes stop_codon:yes gene_type:complete
MAEKDSGLGHIFAEHRATNGSSLYTWTEGGSISDIWTVSSTVGYRGDHSSIDRMRGLCYYGSGPTHSGANVSIFRLYDGTTDFTTDNVLYDNYACCFVHPNGAAFYLDNTNSSPQSTVRIFQLNGIGASISAFGVNEGRAILYATDATPDLFNRPDKNVLYIATDEPSTGWNSQANSQTFYVSQRDMLDGTNSELFDFEISSYTTDTVRSRFAKIFSHPDGTVIIAIGSGTSSDGGFIGRFGRNGSVIWTVGKRTVNSDVRNSQACGLDHINFRWMYWGSGSTSDPEPVALIDMNDGSVVDFVNTHSTSTGNEHRTNSATPISYGRVLNTDTFERPYSQAVWFGGYTGNHNPNPNIADFDGNPKDKFNETDATVTRENTSNNACKSARDNNGQKQMAAMSGRIRLKDTGTNTPTDGMNARQVAYAKDVYLTGDDDYVMTTYTGNQVRQMRHGKFWANGVQMGMGGH